MTCNAKMGNISFALAFALNIVANFLSNTGAFGGNIGEISNKYQTLIVPAGYAFSIWGLIYLSQTVMCIAQLFPPSNSNQLIANPRVVVCWCIANTAQALWVVSFCLEKIAVSCGFMVVLLVCLVVVVKTQQHEAEALSKRKCELDEPAAGVSWVMFFLFQFPMQIHLSWITAACVLNFNILAVEQDAEASCQLCLAVLSYGFLAFVGARGNPTVVLACVLCWALAATANNLSNPSDKISAFFGDVIVDGFRDASAWLAVGAGALAVFQLVGVLCGRKQKKVSSRRQPLVVSPM